MPYISKVGEILKLSEIKERLDTLAKQQPGESIAEYSQRTWDELPRIPYKDLPASLQKAVRESYTAEQIQAALIINFIRGGITNPSSYTAGYTESMKDIPQSDHNKIMIATRNNAIYTIEGKADGLEPVLYANYLFEAFEQTIEEYKGKPTRTDEQDGKKRTVFTRTSMQKAGSTANVMPIGRYQRIPSDKDYQYALTGRVNKHAFIAYLGDDFFEKININRDDFIYDEKSKKLITLYQKSFAKQGKTYPLMEIDFPLLVQHFTQAFESKTAYDANTVTVYTPQFFRRMGVDPALAMQEIYKFRNLWGILPQQQKILSVFTLIGIDNQNNTMTFACPYFMELFDIIPESNHVEKKTKQGVIEYDKPSWNVLCHTDIVKRKNKPAVELVYLVTGGLLQRGSKIDSKTYRSKGREYKDSCSITYDISFSSLINDTVLLKDKIKKAKNPTSVIQRAFKGFYKLLQENTDANDYFCNLKVNEIIPGKNSLDERLVITFTGINGDYSKKH